MTQEAKCPFNHRTIGGGATNASWWPEKLDLGILRQHSEKSDPLGEGFDYAAEFAKLDYAALKKAGAAMVGYGAFITAIITFLILAFVIFQIVKAANRAMPAKPAEPAAPAGPSETDLLIEIRDELKKRG